MTGTISYQEARDVPDAPEGRYRSGLKFIKPC